MSAKKRLRITQPYENMHLDNVTVIFRNNLYSFGAVVGGTDYSKMEPMRVDVFHPGSLAWESMTSNFIMPHQLLAPLQRYGHSVVLYKDCVYIWGGRNDLSTCNELFSFDPVTTLWSKPITTGNRPKSRSGHSAYVLNDKMYVFGGYEEGSDVWCEDIAVLDFVTMSWGSFTLMKEEEVCPIGAESTLHSTPIQVFNANDNENIDTFMNDPIPVDPIWCSTPEPEGNENVDTFMNEPIPAKPIRCATPLPEFHVHDNENVDTFTKDNLLRKLKMEYEPWTQGKPLKSAAKRIIVNVYTKLSLKNPKMSDKNIQKITCCLTGVSFHTMNNIKHETRETGKMITPGKKRPKLKGARTQLVIYGDFTLNTIRRKVHEYYSRQEFPTVKKLVEDLRVDDDLPSLKRTALTKLLHRLNFKYVRRSSRSALIDCDDIVEWRRKYLRTIDEYRKAGCNIVFTDETWVNSGDTHGFSWQDLFVTSHCQAQLEGQSTGIPLPTVHGERLIIIHAGGVNGFVEGALKIFRAKKATGDYHEEIDGPFYQKWFEDQLLPAIPPNSVIVMNNMPYQSVKRDPLPKMGWKKTNIQQWLTKKGVAWDSNMIKCELLTLAEPFRQECEVCIVDYLAKQAGHVVLRLPPYHCDLNPINEVWSHIKTEVANKNTTFNISDVEGFTYAAFSRMPNEKWAQYVQHAIDNEKEMWKLDGLMETVIERYVMEVHESSSSEEQSDAEGEQ